MLVSSMHARPAFFMWFIDCSCMLLIDVPELKPQGQASTGGATGQDFRDGRNTVRVDFSDVTDEVHFVSSEAKDEGSDLKQHIIEVSKHFAFK